jgi:hypothetical protein
MVPSPACVDLLQSGVEPVDTYGRERGTHIRSHAFA